jgi:hypothetical protein
MIVLHVLVNFDRQDWAELERPGGQTRREYRAWLATYHWQLEDLLRARGGSVGLEVVATRNGQEIAPATRDLARLLADVPTGEIIAVALQVVDDDDRLLERRESAFPGRGRACRYCQYPEGTHAPWCLRS